MRRGLLQPLSYSTLSTQGYIMKKLLLVLALTGLLQGCAVQMASSAVGVVAGTAIGVAKVPFQVGGAVVDVVSGD
jgi:hypothetical protein